MSKYLWALSLALVVPGCKSADKPNDAAPTKSAFAVPAGREVQFKGYKGLELRGTFLPAKVGAKSAAVLLLPGSGPSDRDGNQTGLTIDILKQIAERLSEEGVASLRFDKRAVPTVYGKSYPKDLAGLGDFFSWEAFVQDAEAAFDCMKSQAEVDGARTGVLGHSEGGVIAIGMSKKSQPKGLILVSTPARNMGDLILEQLSQGMPSKTTPPDQLKDFFEKAFSVYSALAEPA